MMIHHRRSGAAGEPAEACIYLTIWMWAGFWLGVVTYAVAWFWGGRVERFGAAVLLIYTVIGITNFVLHWEVGSLYLTGRITNCLRLLIFGWLCFRSNRWWPFLMTATTGLIVMVEVIGLLDPAVSPRDAASARVGLGYVINLALLLGVGERILAGEPPAARAAWARANAATVARRNRKKGRVMGPPSAPPAPADDATGSPRPLSAPISHNDRAAAKACAA